MRVWMVVSSGYWDDVRVLKAATSAARHDTVAAVRVLAMDRTGSAPNAVRMGGGPEHRSISVDLFGSSRDQFIPRYAKLLQRVGFVLWAVYTILRYASRGDIVHCHDLDTAVIGWAGKLLRPITWIVDLHEIYAGRPNVSRPYVRVIELIERFLLPKADAVVFVSSAARDYYSSKYTLRRVLVVTNSRPWTPQPGANPLIEEATTIDLVYIGRLTMGRGLEASIRSVSVLPERFRLHIIGFGPLLGPLRTLALDEEVDGRVTFHEAIPIDEVVAQLVCYDIGLVVTELNCLNHRLTVSNKVFEYAAAGLPVVMSPAEEHVRLQDEYQIGAIARVDPNSIATAVMSLGEQERYSTATSGCRRLAVERSWEREYSQVNALYERLAAQTSHLPTR